MSRHQLFIDGRWQDGTGESDILLINPATELPFGSVASAGVEQIDRALASAQRSFEAWRTMRPAKRAEILKDAALRFAELTGPDLEQVFTKQQGKTLAESRGELARAVEMFEWTAAQADHPFEVDYSLPNRKRVAYPKPIGVVAAFTPWNYPAVLIVRKVISGLAAGCTVVLKAAEEVPAPAIAIVRALQEAGVPDGAVNLLFGDPAAISDQLLSSPITRKMSFTGSTQVGKLLAEKASKNLIRSTLELGGHAPVLIFEDADIGAAAASIAEYKFECAGQSCNAPSRIYVQDRVFPQFLEALATETAKIKVGDGCDPTVTMGPLQHRRRLDAVKALFRDAVRRGAKVVTGGERESGPGYFFGPTLLTELADDAEILAQEPFGPILPLIQFSSTAEAIEKANRTPYGLAGYVFTKSEDLADEILTQLAVGYASVNCMSGVPADAPVGGVRDSGYGLEGGLRGIEEYLHPQLVTFVGGFDSAHPPERS
ncbi:NAD-dependent succinate-semialdehyde dehydrogenase [Sinorhizobium americanum]|uniref:Succinate-semialdehyde dehydrogenase/glutarate-semialdehyde dehydrogenase n=1 Tax=Sinorhizobium americanum TaxID=194963 RepID=A0A4R2AVS2_9HYPH|nr:NAD-dependent succinate-semialdehyde dehydrogenase [Sinorhizobium americanum]TCN17971.1 succinate-semialdehyde dehydrogenase/glutarate-semialdehyde dehydrogenase [Sinorhizobium americanum]